jgi:hypothetical protein
VATVTVAPTGSAVLPSPPRRWHPPERTPVPAEPGRVTTNALINVARRARGCRTRGDDRIETRGYAVKRLLWRWACAQRSGRFACSVAQLVAGLAPILGWGPPPAGRVERERWVRAHRKSVQRWLDDLQAAGVLSYEGERDDRGQLWRTVITLRPAPAPPQDELGRARERARSWRHRSRRRQRRRRPLRRSLEAIRRRSGRPQRAFRSRLARRRARELHERRRRAAVEAQIACADQEKDLTHPFGAPPTSEISALTFATPIEPATHHSQGPATPNPAPTVMELDSLAAPTSARGRKNTVVTRQAKPETTCTEETGAGAAPVDPWAGVQTRVAARRAASAWRRHEAARQALQRAHVLAVAPMGRGWGLGRLREAWVVFRFGTELGETFEAPRSGPERVGDHGSGDAGPTRPGQLRRATGAIALYEAFAEARPSGWPAAGAAALCVLAAQRRAATLEGDISRLRLLAKDMRAAALHADPDRVERARRRAERRADASASGGSQGALRFVFRQARGSGRARFETPELRRLRVRDELLRDGDHPGLSPNVFRAGWEAAKRRQAGADPWGDPVLYRLPDGLTERAQRYQRELADGRWALPEDWPSPAVGEQQR